MIKKTVEIVGNSRKWVPAFGNVFVGLNTVDSNGNTSERVYKFENASGDLKMRGGVWAVDSSHGHVKCVLWFEFGWQWTEMRRKRVRRFEYG